MLRFKEIFHFRHLLNEETLFIYWWRSDIKEVNDFSLNLVLRNAFRQNRTISQIRLLDQQQFCHVFDDNIINSISLFYSIVHFSCFCTLFSLEKKSENSEIIRISNIYRNILFRLFAFIWQKLILWRFYCSKNVKYEPNRFSSIKIVTNTLIYIRIFIHIICIIQFRIS